MFATSEGGVCGGVVLSDFELQASEGKDPPFSPSPNSDTAAAISPNSTPDTI